MPGAKDNVLHEVAVLQALFWRVTFSEWMIVSLAYSVRLKVSGWHNHG